MSTCKMLGCAATAMLLGVTLLLAAVAGAAEKVVVGVVGSPNTLYWPFYIGIAKGFFAAEDLTIDLVYAQSSAATMQQLAAGSTDITVGGGLVDPIRAIEKGAPIAIVRILVQAPPYTLLAKRSIKSIKELKGKTISIGGAKDITRIYLERMLAPNGVQEGELDMVFAGSTAARFSALQSGAIDATLLTAPFNFYAIAAGFTELGSTVDYVKDMPFIGMVVNRNWAAAHQSTLQKFLVATSKALNWFEDERNRDEAAKIMVAAGRMKPDEVEKSYDFFRKGKYFETSGKVSKLKLGKVVDALRQLGDIQGQFDVNRLIMPSVTQIVD